MLVLDKVMGFGLREEHLGPEGVAGSRGGVNLCHQALASINPPVFAATSPECSIASVAY
jgi:hypothetical protein